MENHVNNYFVLARFVALLNTSLSDFYIAEVLKTGRNEVQFIFRQKGVEKALKFYLGEDAFVFLPERFSSPRKSQPLFQKLENKKFLGAIIHPHDRSFRIHFSDNFTLVALLYGRNANLLLYQGKAVDAIYNQKIKTNTDKPLSYYKHLFPATEADYLAVSKELGFKKAISQCFAAFTKGFQLYFQVEKLSEKSPEEQWFALKEIEQKLLHSDFHIYTYEKMHEGKEAVLSLLPTPDIEALFTSDIYAALNEFAGLYFKIAQFNAQKKNALQTLRSKIEKAQSKLKSYYFHLEQLETEKNYKHQADLLMAYLHEIPRGAEKAVLTDFDGERKVIIKLKRDVPVQEWAEKLYQKGKKQQIEKEQTEKHIADIEKMLTELQSQLIDAQNATNTQTLKSYLPQQTAQKSVKQLEGIPYKKFDIEGFAILIGKSAADNDKLTFGIAKKDDLWLHAKDVAGSHVIIQNPGRKEIPKSLLEKAAQLAAYFSKGKGSDLYPVLYTLKKFVRKPKGAGPGKVLVEKEKTLLVEPKLV